VNVVMREPAEEEQGFWLQGPANGEERGSEGARERGRQRSQQKRWSVRYKRRCKEHKLVARGDGESVCGGRRLDFVLVEMKRDARR
jgi:hypothetical protein